MFMIEGTWSGYRSEQSHVAHRDYLPNSRKAFAEKVKTLGSITFGDGTHLHLTVTEVKSRSLPAKLGYVKLIEDCVYAGVNSVYALNHKSESVHETTPSK